MALALVEEDQGVLQSLSLDELAVRVGDLYAALQEAEGAALAWALDMGDVFLEVQRRFREAGDPSWLRWVDERLPLKRTTVTGYMRLAYRRDDVAQSGECTIKGALKALVGGSSRRSGPTRLSAAAKAEMRTLRSEGFTMRQIAGLVGCNEETARYHLNPEGWQARVERDARRKKDRYAADQALKKQEREEALRAAAVAKGGSIARVWADHRKLLVVLDAAVAEVPVGSDEYKELYKARQTATLFEGQINAALSASRQS